MKKTIFVFCVAAFSSLVAASPAHANKFTASDWSPLQELDNESLALEQNIDKSGHAQTASKDLQQLLCLNYVNTSLVHVQSIVTQEKELLQIAAQMVHPDDEKKVEDQQITDIPSDLTLLKGYKEQTAMAAKMCSGNGTIANYAKGVDNLDDRAVSYLASIQARLVVGSGKR